MWNMKRIADVCMIFCSGIFAWISYFFAELRQFIPLSLHLWQSWLLEKWFLGDILNMELYLRMKILRFMIG